MRSVGWRMAVGLSLLAMGCHGGETRPSCDAGLAALDWCLTGDGDRGMCQAGECVVFPACTGETCADNVTFPLGDTRIGYCYGDSSDGDGTIDCPGSAGDPTCADEAYCGQDAQYQSDGWPARVGRVVTSKEGGQEAAQDLVTGLTWQRCVSGQASVGSEGCDQPATRGSWHDAVAYCQNSEWAGHDDWVLPEAAALHSIVDFQTTSPAISANVLSNPPSLFSSNGDEWWIECMWSATEDANDANVAWALMVNSGDISRGSGLVYHANDKDAVTWPGCYTTCVRAPTRPTQQRFVTVQMQGEAVVVDTVGERIWQGCSVGQSGADCAGTATPMPWAQALATCQAETWGGYDDWRLPDIVELYSIADPKRTRPAVDPAVFPNTPYYTGSDNLEGQYWSSTARSYNNFALYVSFNDANTHFYVQDEARHVRCVRGQTQ